MHIFESFLDVVSAMIGNIDPKKQYITRISEYKETTLMYALLAHLKCRFHLNLIDYENALKYSEKTLSYIDACLKQQRTIISISNKEIVQEYPINTTLQYFEFQVYDQLINETHDVDYIHLFNKDFINDAILNHIIILINIEKNLPKFNLLFELQLELQNKIHINYLQMIYATYFYYLFNYNHQIQIENCFIDHANYLEILKVKIANEEMKQSAYYALKFNMISEITEIDQKLKILDFQLNILLGTKNGINKKLINNWIMQ